MVIHQYKGFVELFEWIHKNIQLKFSFNDFYLNYLETFDTVTVYIRCHSDPNTNHLILPTSTNCQAK